MTNGDSEADIAEKAQSRALFTNATSKIIDAIYWP
jgi:hypothetical protein